jgi:hypothetical protein
MGCRKKQKKLPKQRCHSLDIEQVMLKSTNVMTADAVRLPKKTPTNFVRSRKSAPLIPG